MTTPIYIPNFAFIPRADVSAFIGSIAWLDRTSARMECFMSEGEGGVEYTYGEGRGERTYTSIPMTPRVANVMAQVNEELARRSWGPMNGCFLNYYPTRSNALGWHADDFRRMDHTRPVAVVSWGAEREIWWRANGESGVVPPENRQLLGHGSLFVMPPGFQHTHQHRIPKGDREVEGRVSLTFRAFL